MDVEQIDSELRHLDEIERTIADELTVTNSYMPQVYELRQHIEFVAGKLRDRKLQLQAQAMTGSQQTGQAAVGAQTQVQGESQGQGNGHIEVQA